MPHVVGGTVGHNKFKGVSFLQFQVDGREANPFILCLSSDTLPHDNWPSERPSPGSSSASFLFLKTQDAPRPYASALFSTNEISTFEAALKKSFEWHELAVKENLIVADKQLFSLTNRQFAVSFQKPGDTTNYSLTMSFRDTSPRTIDPTWFSLSLDQKGVEKFLAVVTNLSSRRSNYLAFRLSDARQEQERREKEAREKARADEVLR